MESEVEFIPLRSVSDFIIAGWQIAAPMKPGDKVAVMSPPVAVVHHRNNKSAARVSALTSLLRTRLGASA